MVLEYHWWLKQRIQKTPVRCTVRSLTLTRLPVQVAGSRLTRLYCPWPTCCCSCTSTCPAQVPGLLDKPVVEFKNSSRDSFLYARTMALRYLVTIITLVSVAATDPIPLSSFHFAQTQYVAADPGMLSTSMNSGTGASMWGVWQQDPGIWVGRPF